MTSHTQELKPTFHGVRQKIREECHEKLVAMIRTGQIAKLIRGPIESQDFLSYSGPFVRLLGSVYSNLRASHCGFAEGMAYQAFTFGEKSTLEWLDWSQHIGELVKQNSAAPLIRFYEGNTLIIVKPDRLRNWIASTAIRDADETLVDLQKQTTLIHE